MIQIRGSRMMGTAKDPNLLHSPRFTSNQLCNEVLELWPTSFRENWAFTFENNEPKMVRNI